MLRQDHKKSTAAQTPHRSATHMNLIPYVIEQTNRGERSYDNLLKAA
jgi:hypothetical protein